MSTPPPPPPTYGVFPVSVHVLHVMILFCVSEDSCLYRYQYDNLIELTATWDAVDGSGVEGQVSVTQVSVDEEEGLAKLQISVFLTAASRRGPTE